MSLPPVTNQWRELWLELQANAASIQDCVRRLRDDLEGHEENPQDLRYVATQLRHVERLVFRSQERMRKWHREGIGVDDEAADVPAIAANGGQKGGAP